MTSRSDTEWPPGTSPENEVRPLETKMTSDIASGIFGNERIPAMGIEIDFEACELRLVHNCERGVTRTLHAGESGEYFWLKPSSDDRIYIDVIDANTLLMGSKSGAGVVLPRWSE